jgi:uncharacterized protein YaaR (DUF327 family)
MRVNRSPGITLPREVPIKAGNGEKPFFEHLETASIEHLKHHMGQELEVIHELGRKLSRSLSLADLKKYKQKVSDFLKLCISEGLCYKEEKFSSKYGRTKILSLVETVNKKLLSLAEILLSENKDSLRVMALVDEIRGLLLDLYA